MSVPIVTDTPVAAYLDHAAATEFLPSQLAAFAEDMLQNQYGNPHSRNSRGSLTAARVEEVRDMILRHFGTSADHYAVVFTSNCSAALKMVAESFAYKACSGCSDKNIRCSNGTFAPEDWEDLIARGGPCFLYTSDNHTSVVGMRLYASKAGAGVYCVHADQLSSALYKSGLKSRRCQCTALMAYPGQSNFCGRRYPTDWATQLRTGILGPQRWFTCLDAAALAPTKRFPLGHDGPDFVGISFYKMFGFPTGIGALLIRRQSASMLRRPYFGGGTAKIYSSTLDIFQPRDEVEKRFEDGTIGYQLVVALKHGFDALHQAGDCMPDHWQPINSRFAGGTDAISAKVFRIAQGVYNDLVKLQHANGAPVVHVYCKSKFNSAQEQGGTIAFNLLQPDGSWVGFNYVDRIAQANDIQLRTGCFCNQGACQLALGMNDDEAKHLYELGAKKCGDDVDLLDGRPMGCVRVSFGWTSTESDAVRFMNFIETCFVDSSLADRLSKQASISNGAPGSRFLLVKAFVYPIKSCAPIEVKDRWRVGLKGLWLDRHWMVVDSYGVRLDASKCPALRHLRMRVEGDRLRLSSDRTPDALYLQVTTTPSFETARTDYKICSRRQKACDCGEEAAGWLSQTLGMPGVRLVTSTDENSLNNASQYLLLNRATVRRLLEEMHAAGYADMSEEDLILRFRPNFVIDGDEPFEEETWERIQIGSGRFRNVGKCHRCSVIAVDPNNGRKNSAVIKALKTLRGNEFTFGIYLEMETGLLDHTEWINIHDLVREVHD